ncbi:hypothetical protein ACO0R3_001689 [Hanseniaspora guilliermondii]
MTSILIVIDNSDLNLGSFVNNDGVLRDSATYSNIAIIDVLLNYFINDPFELDYKLNKLYTSLREKCDYTVSINVFYKHAYFDLTTLLKNTYSNIFLSEMTSSSLPHTPYRETLLTSTINYQKEISSSTKHYQAKCFDISAVGGTFDHIHDGHKILLCISAFLTKSKLIIGLTAEQLLVNKKFKSQLQTFDTRKKHVLEFTNKIDSSLTIDILPIKDVCGPTGYEPNIQALIVSKETQAGGDTVNKVRTEKGLSALDIFVVDILGGEEKLSSTTLRQMEYERLKNDKKNQN